MNSEKVIDAICAACPGKRDFIVHEFNRGLREHGYPARIILLGLIEEFVGITEKPLIERAKIAARSIEDGFAKMFSKEFPDVDYETMMLDEERKRSADRLRRQKEPRR